MNALTTRERPILFSGPMIRAILEGRKTMTRRVIKPQPKAAPRLISHASTWTDEHTKWSCPYGVPGDRLWVRESWAIRAAADYDKDVEKWALTRHDAVWHPADGDKPSGCAGGMGRTRPPIFMPRWASRLTLEIVEVRVERVQEISGKNAMAEGIHYAEPQVGSRHQARMPTERFKALWDRLNAKRGYGWDSNPWVWVIAFKRIE